MSWLQRFRRRRRQALEHAVRSPAQPGVDKRDWITHSIKLWASAYGEPPTYTDWSRARAISRNDTEALVRMGDVGDWPTARQVIRAFTTWNAALEAAGFQRRPAHRPRRSTVNQTTATVTA